jgi:outer membrane protein assembly factor BamB
VDSIGYPVDGVSIEHDDFGLWRASFGGRHTGIDMAFGREGDPVHASARGQVTYADPNGWNAEKGVIIIAHTFPDGSVYYSLYGHVEQKNGYVFPKVGACVEKGDVIASVGHPECCAPHLHYEIRLFGSNNGGPGYAPVDPLLNGWLHPIDFTERWQLALRPGFVAMHAANSPPVAPPIFLADGGLILAEVDQIEQQTTDGTVTWRLDVPGLVGVVTLPDGRLLATTGNQRAYVIANGQFSAVWQFDRVIVSPPMRMGDLVLFLTADRRVAAYGGDGALRWQTDPFGDHIEESVMSRGGDQLAISYGDNGGSTFKLGIVDASGHVLYTAAAPAPVTPIAAPDGFYVLTASQIGHLNKALVWQPLIDTGLPIGRGAQIAVDKQGAITIYPGYGTQLYNFAPDGTRRWQTNLTGTPRQPPLLAASSGCLVYALTADGALLAFDGTTGRLRGLTTLYAGGEHGHEAARWLHMLPGEQVQFAAGYSSIATESGPALSGVTCA